jgi:hypothetical protein
MNNVPATSDSRVCGSRWIKLGSNTAQTPTLGSKIRSNDLEEWVKHESEGYPQDAVLPDYRIVGVTYKGTFSGPFGSGIKNAPIPPILIKTFANDSWNNYSVRESIAAVDELVKVSTKGGSLGINASNLILLLQGRYIKVMLVMMISLEIFQ